MGQANKIIFITAGCNSLFTLSTTAQNTNSSRGQDVQNKKSKRQSKMGMGGRKFGGP